MQRPSLGRPVHVRGYFASCSFLAVFFFGATALHHDPAPCASALCTASVPISPFLSSSSSQRVAFIETESRAIPLASVELAGFLSLSRLVGLVVQDAGRFHSNDGLAQASRTLHSTNRITQNSALKKLKRNVGSKMLHCLSFTVTSFSRRRCQCRLKIGCEPFGDQSKWGCQFDR
ncbi:hypothetical protein B0H14DRAFT_574550 [Mycena olivaceomarginata]|nr:hypothetical protein B0H14DRAFT_574550 [Mycena olivaceomarginata]